MIAYFGPDFCPLNATSLRFAAGRFKCLVFFVRSTIPPVAPGWMPTALSLAKPEYYIPEKECLSALL